MPLKAVLLHIGEKGGAYYSAKKTIWLSYLCPTDQANTRIIQQMRSIGSPTSLEDGKTYYRKDYINSCIVHVHLAFSYRNLSYRSSTHPRDRSTSAHLGCSECKLSSALLNTLATGNQPKHHLRTIVYTLLPRACITPVLCLRMYVLYRQ